MSNIIELSNPKYYELTDKEKKDLDEKILLFHKWIIPDLGRKERNENIGSAEHRHYYFTEMRKYFFGDIDHMNPDDVSYMQSVGKYFMDTVGKNNGRDYKSTIRSIVSTSGGYFSEGGQNEHFIDDDFVDMWSGNALGIDEMYLRYNPNLENVDDYIMHYMGFQKKGLLVKTLYMN